MTLAPTSPWESSTTTPCRDDLDLWFAEKPEALAVAQSLCGGCPLREPCLDGALARREPWGVWGGRILVDGAVVAVKRGRGRPPRRPALAAVAPPAG